MTNTPSLQHNLAVIIMVDASFNYEKFFFAIRDSLTERRLADLADGDDRAGDLIFNPCSFFARVTPIAELSCVSSGAGDLAKKKN